MEIEKSTVAQAIEDKTQVAKVQNKFSYAQQVKARISSSSSDFSSYQVHRHGFKPITPLALETPNGEKISLKEDHYPIKETLKPIFPTLLKTGDMPYFELSVDNEGGSPVTSDRPLRVSCDDDINQFLKLGCVLSGGQAAGGHNVIMGMFDMVKQLHPDSKLFGFLAGPHGVFSGNYMEITPEYMNLYRNMGGFDMIRSGRHKIETPEQFASSLKNVNDLNLDGLAVIGGDDSNTNACLLAEYFAKNDSKCAVVGCPKTIDGDLRNEHIQVTFGFDTATKVYAEAIGNLCTDAVSSRKYYYFVRLMGRSASHIALECALQTRVNCVLIGEEVAAKEQTLEDITIYLADIICKRAERGKDYGMVLVPEGLIEFIPEVKVLISEINEVLAKEFEGDVEQYVQANLSEGSRALFNRLPQSVSHQLLLDRDPHGNVQVSKIDTERLLILMVMRELSHRKKVGIYKGTFRPQSHFFGYEGRCALPSNFDSSYCYAIGKNAAYLMLQKKTGYMSCIKNLGNSDPKNWVAAGCPLPAMMGIERRKGKDKPVITKALVELDGPMFKCYETVRAKWAFLDCYQSPGPIQFTGAASTQLNFMVSPPDIDSFVYATDVQEKYESRNKKQNFNFRQQSSLSELSRQRIRDEIEIPEQLTNGNFKMVAIKRYTPYSQLVESKIGEQFADVDKERRSTYFVELQDRIASDQGTYVYADEQVQQLNKEFTEMHFEGLTGKIAVVQLGNPAPGCNNVIDGMLKYQYQNKGVTLVGVKDGLTGFKNDQLITITEESFAPYRNLGGTDYLGLSESRLHPENWPLIVESVKKHGINGLILIGATHTLTDGARLTNHFLENKVDCNVVVVPATLDGNVRHQYIQMSLGFDTASKVYSQLIGNMLTDSASAIKYWYFIRLMGKDPSHLALECALKTHPNMVIISEECAFRGENLPDIVNRIADVVEERANQGKNYGTVLIPEGLLAHLSAYRHLINELNGLFQFCKSEDERHELANNLTTDDTYIKEHLSPWSFSLFATLPDFMKIQLINEQEISGSVNLSQLETEKLISHFVQFELKRRKNKGKYTGSFAPVTHFFGYQGRAAHPSQFDCNLGSTLGFTACALLMAGLTGHAVSVKELTNEPAKWRVGGVPILALLRSQPKAGYKRNELVVPSQEVSMTDMPYQVFKANERDWKFVDHYCNPGPIQYADFGADSTSNTLRELYLVETDISEQIKGICNSIQNSTMFAEDEHLLVAALSALKAAKGVLNSMSEDQILGKLKIKSDKIQYQ